MNSQHIQNHRLRTDSSRCHRVGGGSFFTLNFAVVKTHTCFGQMEGSELIHQHRETFKLNYHNMTVRR